MLNCAIIDDEKSVHKIIKDIVKKDSLPLTISESGYDGVEGKNIIKNNKFDIIFIDIQMPYLDGFDLISKYPENNYIIVTAFDYFDYAQKALRLGVKDILLKPIDRNQLAEAISRAIGFTLTHNEIIDKVLLYIHRNYSQEIMVSDIAKKYFMNSSNFSRLFKNSVGISMVDYIRKLRIARAKDLLDSSYKSISEISIEVGYKSENLFYKDFKRIESITPSKYRDKGI